MPLVLREADPRRSNLAALAPRRSRAATRSAAVASVDLQLAPEAATHGVLDLVLRAGDLTPGADVQADHPVGNPASPGSPLRRDQLLVPEAEPFSPLLRPLVVPHELSQP